MLALRALPLVALLCSSATAQPQNACPVVAGDPDTNMYIGLLETAGIVFRGRFQQPAVEAEPVLTVTLNASQVIFTNVSQVTPTLWATECVYQLRVNFSTNVALIVSGAPSNSGNAAAQRCWKVEVTDASSASWSVSAPGFSLASNSRCTFNTPLPAFVASGTVSDYEQTTTPVVPVCPVPSPNEGYAALLGQDSSSPPVVVLAPTYISVVYPWRAGPAFPNNFAFLTSCIAAAYPFAASGSTPAYEVLNATSECFALQPSTEVPGLFASYLTPPPPGGCASVSWSLPANGGYPFIISSPSAPTPTPTPGPPIVKRQVPSVVLSVTMSSSDSVMNSVEVLVSPCFIFALRQSIAPPNTPLNGTFITSIAFSSGATIALATTYSGNVYDIGSNPCGASRRAAESDGNVSARLLDAAYTATAAVTIVTSSTAAQTALVSSLASQGAYEFPYSAFTAACADAGETAPSTSPSSSAPFGIAASTAVIGFPVPALPRIKPYIPSALVLSAHSMPRLGGATNELPKTFSTSDPMSLFSDPYAKGILLPAAILIGLGIVLFVVFAFAFCCACCRCCQGLKCRRDRAKFYTGVRKYAGPERVLVFFAVVNLALVLSAIAFVPGFSQGVDSVGATVTTLYATLTNATALVGSSDDGSYTILNPPPLTTFVFPNGTSFKAYTSVQYLSNGLAYADAMNEAANLANSSSSTTQKAVISAIATAWKPAVDTVKSSASSIEDAVDGFGGIQKQVQDASDSYSKTITLAGTIVLALASCLIFLQSIAVCRNTCACCYFKGFAPLTLLLTSLICILAGVFYAVGLVGSDVCWDPNTVLNTYVTTSLSGPNAQSFS